MRSDRFRRLGIAIALIALTGCTTGQIRLDVAETFDSQGAAIVKGVCDTVLALAGGADSRDDFEADLDSMSDEALVSLFREADGSGIPAGVEHYSGDEMREWQLATWDECADRGHL